LDYTATIKVCAKRIHIFSGRASRSEFWSWFLFVFVIALGLGFALGFFLPSIIMFGGSLLAIGSRRLHDMDRSARWLLLPIGLFGIGFLCFFVGLNLAFGGPSFGIASSIVFFSGMGLLISAFLSPAFLIAAGTPGANRFGDTPSLRQGTGP
jgi:uncharacterized membrane protein YhaH (DUF805 family)